MMDMISWPVVGTIAASAGVLLVVGLFYHAGRRAGAFEVLNMIKFKISRCCTSVCTSEHIDGLAGMYELCKEIRDEYDLD